VDEWTSQLVLSPFQSPIEASPKQVAREGVRETKGKEKNCAKGRKTTCSYFVLSISVYVFTGDRYIIKR